MLLRIYKWYYNDHYSFQNFSQFCTAGTKQSSRKSQSFSYMNRWILQFCEHALTQGPYCSVSDYFPCSFPPRFPHYTQLPSCGHMFHSCVHCPWEIPAAARQCSFASVSFPPALSLNNVPYAFFKVYWFCSLESVLYLKWRIWKYGDH